MPGALRKSLIFLFMAAVVSCGPRHQSHDVDPGADLMIPSALSLDQTESQAGENPAVQKDDQVAPLLFHDQRQSALPAYQMPEKFRERLSKVEPRYVPAQTKSLRYPFTSTRGRRSSANC